jgi:hypothetical protein
MISLCELLLLIKDRLEGHDTRDACDAEVEGLQLSSQVRWNSIQISGRFGPNPIPLRFPSRKLLCSWTLTMVRLCLDCILFR